MKEKTLIFIAHEGALSGANLCLLEYFKILHDHNFKLYLIVPRLGQLSNMAKAMGIQVHEIYYYGWTVSKSKNYGLKTKVRKFLRNKIALSQISKLIKSLNPDFICTNTITINIGAIAAKRNGVPHIWFIHEFGDLDHGFSLKGGMIKGQRRILELSEKVVANSNAVLQVFPESEKLMVVNNPVLGFDYIQRDAKSENDRLKLLMLGQIAKSKNQVEAIEAIKIVQQKGVHVQLDIYGNVVDKKYMDSLKNLITQNNLNDYVFIHGYTTEIRDPLKNVHALLICSRMEAFGRVTIEALKTGIPVIGANTGGTNELIVDGANGYLYDAGNPMDLAEKIILLNNNYTNFNLRAISEMAKAEYNKENTWHQLEETFLKHE